MNKRNWRKFDKLAEECYANKIGTYNDWHCWIKAFHQLRESILEERQTDPGFAPDLHAADEAMDFEYDIQGWLNDCFETLAIKEEYELLLRMCDELLDIFGGEKGASSDVGSSKASALRALGRYDEAVQYCREWMTREPGNIMAASEVVRSLNDAGEYDEAKKLIVQHIPEGTECDSENIHMFFAALIFYRETGDDKALKKIEEAIDKHYENIREWIVDVDDDFINKLMGKVFAKDLISEGLPRGFFKKKAAEHRRESGKFLQ